MELTEQVMKLRKQLSLINLYSDPQQQPSIDIRDLLMQFYKDMRELKMRVKEFKADLVPSEEGKNEWNVEGAVDVLTSLIWNENISESEFGTWIDIAHGLILKGEFQYEESCRVLERQWKLVQSNKGVEVLVLGLVVGEVMGLHLGRFEEGLAILEKSLEVVNELYPKSEIALQLSNMKVAIFINVSDSTKELKFCIKTVENFRDASTSEVSFGTALYFCITVQIVDERISHPEIRTLIEEWTIKNGDSSNNLAEHIRLYLNASLKMMDEDNNAAEHLLQQAEELTKQYFPTSIYAALCWIMNVLLKYKADKIQDVADFPDDECMRTHFPVSTWRLHILEHKAALYNDMGEVDKEIEMKLSIHFILQFYPSCDSFTQNINELVNVCESSGNDQAALIIRESAYRILLERAFDSPALKRFQSSLIDRYQSLGQPEKALEIYAETIRKLQATDFINELFSEMLSTLATWTEVTQRDKARQMCVDSYMFLREKHPRSETYFSAVKTLGKMYKSLGQQEKVEEIVLEGVQTAKTFYQFKQYVYFTYSLTGDFELNKFPKEKQFNILTEIYDFLVSNPSSDCFNTAQKIESLFSDQPEKLLKILLEVHQLLLNDVTSNNFLDNIRVLAKHYSREKAIQFLIEMTRLLSAHPTCGNYQMILRLLETNCRLENRLDIALEQYTEAYRILQPATNPEHDWIVRPLCILYLDMEKHDTVIQIVQFNLSSQTVLNPADRDSMAPFAKTYLNLNRYEAISDLYFKAIQIYYTNGYYDEIYLAIDPFFRFLHSSEGKNRMIATFLEIMSALEKVGKEKIYSRALTSLLDFCKDNEWENAEGIRIQKKILLHVLSRDPCDVRIVPLLVQAGGFLWNEREREKAEACYFRGTLTALQRASGDYQVFQGTIKDLRSLYSGSRVASRT